MAGLFQGVVNENPLYVDNSEKYAKRAEEARDEAVQAEHDAAEHAKNAANSAESAKGSADRADVAADKTAQDVFEVNKIKSDIKYISSTVKVDKAEIEALIEEGRELSVKFDEDEEAIQALSDSVNIKHSDVLIKHQEVSEMKDATEDYRDDVEGMWGQVKVMSSQVTADTLVVTAAKDIVVEKQLQVSEDANTVERLTGEVVEQAFEVKVAHNEVIQTGADVARKYEEIKDIHFDVTNTADQVTYDANKASQAASNALQSELNAKASEQAANASQSVVEGLAGDVSTARVEVLQARDDVNSIVPIVEAARDVAISAKDQASASASQSKASEDQSKIYYDKTYDIYEDLKEGQVYRGTWNVNSGSYPVSENTNSTWDVVLNEGQETTGVSFDGKLWLAGDRLIYVMDHTKYYRIASGSTVLTVNGKKGNVNLDAKDVGALSTISARSASLDNTSGVVNETYMNLDDMKAGSFYVSHRSSANFPPMGGELYGYVETKSIYSHSALLQTVWGYEGSGSLCMRHYSQNANKWFPWRVVYDTSNKPTPSDIGVYTKDEIDGLIDSASGSVESVNGQTGVVVLGSGDVGAYPLGGGFLHGDLFKMGGVIQDHNGEGSLMLNAYKRGAVLGSDSANLGNNIFFNGGSWVKKNDTLSSGLLTSDVNGLMYSTSNTGESNPFTNRYKVFHEGLLPNKLNTSPTLGSSHAGLLWQNFDGTIGANSEYLKFTPSTGDIRTNGYLYGQQGFYHAGHMVYSPLNKPTPTEIGTYTKAEIDGKNTLSFRDIRDTTSLPNIFESFKMTPWFSNQNTPTGGWCSGLTMKGWADGYRVWQLAADSGPGSYNVNKLYFRSGTESTWDSTAEVYTTLNKPTAEDVGALPITGGYLSGGIQIGSEGNRLVLNNRGDGSYFGNMNTDRYLYLYNDDRLCWGTDQVYHEGFKPTPSDIGTYTKSEIDGLIGTGSGGTAGVTSINGKTGVVELEAGDIGALPTSGGNITGELTWQNGVHKIKPNGDRFLHVEGGEYILLSSGKGAKVDGAVYIGCNLYYDAGWKKHNVNLGSSLLEFTNNKDLTMICSEPGSNNYTEQKYKVYHQGNRPTAAEIGTYTKAEVDDLIETSSGGGAVSSVNGKTGIVDLTFSDVGAASAGHAHGSQYVPTERTVNGKELRTNVILTAGDVGALPLSNPTVTGSIKISGSNGMFNFESSMGEAQYFTGIVGGTRSWWFGRGTGSSHNVSLASDHFGTSLTLSNNIDVNKPLYIQGGLAYHSGNKPTAADVGAVASLNPSFSGLMRHNGSGTVFQLDTPTATESQHLTGNVGGERYWWFGKGGSNSTISLNATKAGNYLNLTEVSTDVGKDLFVTGQKVYHTGNKPTLTEIGAADAQYVVRLDDRVTALENSSGGGGDGEIVSGVSSVNGKVGVVQLYAADVRARSETWVPTLAEVGAAAEVHGHSEYVPSVRTINYKPLLSDVVITAVDTGALPTTGGNITGDLGVEGSINMGNFSITRSGNKMMFMV